ncbi:MAG TPA: 4-hydroxy-tetrahydrodipicolinate reductase [Victivallales bacterium]|nr:4-hydroxy-tetrahydrodipicolinate reductase [Victivallales bacterium]HPO91477.1 4-hydroxy-tetrahydrodipicolinate reductase [Victivallales bacterium]HRR28383.1 4-hydroxy-tetrahydrodipicolinate reductase [Victivallales bacterium]HRU01342.1 4-hydroxy-tetrahydrodipicolinate reductase [Victivallales bacterium]
MIKVCIIGAGGRMGKRLVNLILDSEDFSLIGATEIPGSGLIGQDAGLVAGTKAAGIKISDSIEKSLNNADVMIDFSTSNVVENAKIANSLGVAAVIGTTGLDERAKSDLEKIAKDGGKIVYATNMSVGINVLLNICKELAHLLSEDYDIEVVEMHHRNKKDAPSGTALSLAEALCEGSAISMENCIFGRKGLTGIRPKKEIGIHALRGGDVVGDHTVIFATDGERIELTHRASNRDAFAKGALRAARFIKNAKPGFYNMQDVLGLKKLYK